MSDWRYLTDDGVAAATGLATDEAMMLSYGRDGRPRREVTLRLYTYRPHCALVGRYQSLEDEIDLDFCRLHDLQVGRRPTGGGAIIMGPGQLGVALASAARAEETPRAALRRYADGVVAGLAALGIEARFRNKNDLEVGGRKIAGLGLYLDPRGAMLFHASVLVDLDVPLMLQVLRIPGVKLEDKGVARVEERVTTVSRQLGRPLAATDVREELGPALAAWFGATLEPAGLEPEERSLLERLIAERYGHDGWIFERSPRRDARGSALLKTPGGLLRIFVGLHGEALKSVLVTGDFNVLPPAIPTLESALRWCRASQERIAEVTREALSGDDLGVEPERVAGAVWEATRGALELRRSSHPHRGEGSCYFPDPAAVPAGADPSWRRE